MHQAIARGVARGRRDGRAAVVLLVLQGLHQVALERVELRVVAVQLLHRVDQRVLLLRELALLLDRARRLLPRVVQLLGRRCELTLQLFDLRRAIERLRLQRRALALELLDIAHEREVRDAMRELELVRRVLREDLDG